MKTAAEAAARCGHILVRPRATAIDALEVLQELGGSGTVYDVCEHIGKGKGSQSSTHARYQALELRGLVGRTGSGTQRDPYLYALTCAARILLADSPQVRSLHEAGAP